MAKLLTAPSNDASGKVAHLHVRPTLGPGRGSVALQPLRGVVVDSPVALVKVEGDHGGLRSGLEHHQSCAPGAGAHVEHAPRAARQKPGRGEGEGLADQQYLVHDEESGEPPRGEDA
jgi:hypothetical protein